MTAFDRFDPFELRIADAIDEIAAARTPDYLDDIFQRTAASKQRPRWTFLERWLPVDTTLSRGPAVGRLPIRGLAILLILAALVVGTLVAIVGAQKRVPAPFGPAANGSIVYASNGDLYVRDSLAGDARVLIGGAGEQIAPDFSPDGTLLSFVSTEADGDHFSIAKADGTSIRRIALIPKSGNAQAQWAPDSSTMGLIYDVDGAAQLSMVPVNGGIARVIDLGGLKPLDLSWQPPRGDRLLVRAQAPTGSSVRLYTLKPDGSDLIPVGKPQDSSFGPDWSLTGSGWSPDGKRIAYNSVEPDRVEPIEHFRIHVMNADGTNDTLVPSPADPHLQQAWPHFSPDGNWISVNQWRFKGDDTHAQGWLGVMPSDLSAPARDIGPKFDGGEDTGLPSFWSPDGTRVITVVGNAGQVWSIDPVTGQDELLPWAVEMPGWLRLAP